MSNILKSKEETNPILAGKGKVPEVHYIPFERIEEILKPDHFKIDFISLLRTIWNGRIKLLFCVFTFGILGIFIAYFSTTQYQSYALLIPEISSAPQSRTEQLLQRYGSELGIGNIMGVQEGVLPPMLFSTIVNSTPFQIELMETELTFQNLDGKVSYRDYVENYSKPSPVDYAAKYTIGLPKTLLVRFKQLIIKQDDAESDDWVTNTNENELVILRLSKKEQEQIDGLRSRIIVEQNIENGLIYSAVTMPDPIAAAELNYAVVELLKKYITDYQLQKVREDLEYTLRMKEESEKKFNEAQFELAEFLDRNRAVSTSIATIELERLRDKKNLAFGIYNSVSQRLEQTKLALNEQRPTFKEVQPVTVPTNHSAPKRLKVMAANVLLGVFFGLFIIFSKSKIIDIYSRIKT